MHDYQLRENKYASLPSTRDLCASRMWVIQRKKLDKSGRDYLMSLS